MSGFRKFLLRGNVVELAIAVVIGAAFVTVIQALVKGFVTPLIGMFGGLSDFAQYTVEVNNSRFLVGEFINALMTFVLIAAIIYFLIVVPYTRLSDRFTPTPTPPQPTRDCPHCLSKIPLQASRCAFCTSEVSATGMTT